MTGFSIGDVERITSVKAHVLRYWEEVIPSLAPVKDIGGRRTYSKREYLIQEKKYTIEGARAELLQEAAAAGSPNSADTLIPQLNRIRFELLDLYRMLHHSEKEEPQ